MKAQRDEFLNSLTKYGWQVIDIEEFYNVPFSRDWVDELWIIESFWRPVGFRSFIFFLVDPQSGFERRKGEQVWAVRVSKESHEKGFGADYEDFPIRKGHWKETLEEIFAKLAKLRQRGLT